MDRMEFIRQIREKRERWESLYSKGMLTPDELFRYKTTLYHDAAALLAGNVSGEDAVSSEELFELCGLRAEEFGSGDAGSNPDHDPLADGAVYIFKGLTGLEELVRERNPEGKTFTFQIPLTRKKQRVWKELRFEVRRRAPGEARWQGWTMYEGFGRFSIYSGEGTLAVSEENGAIRSVLYQKCYR